MNTTEERGVEILIFANPSPDEKCGDNANKQPNSGGCFRRVVPGADLVKEGRKMAQKLSAFLK